MHTTENFSKDYEAIINTVQQYIEGSRKGKSEIMRSSFHPDATIVGFFGGGLVSGHIKKLFDLIDGNGPAPEIEPSFTGIDIMETIAVVRLEVRYWSGEVIGPDPRTMSDLFNLIKTGSEWKITHKMFHLHIP